MPDPATPPADAFQDLRPILDRELDRLPEKYRSVVVLCDLEGRKRREVAQELGLAEGTLSSRLNTARRMLAKRLGRRGVTLSAGMLAVALAQQAQAAVPAAMAKATLQAAAQLAAGKAIATVGVSAQVVATFKGVLKTMLLAKLKVGLLWLAAVGLLAGALGTVFAQGQVATTDPTPEEEVKTEKPAALDAAALAAFRDHLQSRSWTMNSLDREQGIITLQDRPTSMGGLVFTFGGNERRRVPDQKGALIDGLRVAKYAKVSLNGRNAKLADLRNGMAVLVKVGEGNTTITEIQAIASGQQDQYFVESVNLKKKTVTLTVNLKTVELPLAKDAKIIAVSIPAGANEPQNVEGRMVELARGTPVHVQIGMEDDRMVVRSLRVASNREE